MRTIRVTYQIFFLALFVFLGFLAQSIFLGDWPISLFFQLDPLVGLSGILSSRTLHHGLLWGLAVLILTIFFGRAWCNWICPLGTIHHFIGWLSTPKKLADRITANSPRKLYGLKYYLLAGILVLALFGSLQIGWLDPICLLSRSFNLIVWPTAHSMTARFYQSVPELQFAWIAGVVFVVLLALNAVIPRFFCRALCPLGALLGLFSRFALFRVQRDEHACTNCGRCAAVCEGAASPDEKLRLSECTVCLKCIHECPENALRFAFLPDRQGQRSGPDFSRRRLILAGVLGGLFYPVLRTSRAVTGGPVASLIRPPGALPEEKFLETCLKCGQCIRVCPTNVIQPAFFESGLEGFWTPLLKYHNRQEGKGFCQYECTACSQVCPTGALRTITMDEKTGRGAFAANQVKIGTAFVDRGRCLPWAMDRPCQVCEEVCPVSPKAIRVEQVPPSQSLSGRTDIKRPLVNPARCIGCGACQSKCPVTGLPAIRVQPSGQSRSSESSFLLKTTATPAWNPPGQHTSP